MTGQSLPVGREDRKGIPLARGLLDYFPNALAAVARVSKAGNDVHNPGEEMHHARGKSMDHADCILRHLVDRGSVDPEDGLRHTAKVAWRALALLQEELEREEGVPLPRGAKVESVPHPDSRASDKLFERFPTLADSEKLELSPHESAAPPSDCPNDADDRIAGACPTSRKIKNRYYHGEPFPVGSKVVVDSPWAVSHGVPGTVVDVKDSGELNVGVQLSGVFGGCVTYFAQDELGLL